MLYTVLGILLTESHTAAGLDNKKDDEHLYIKNM